MQVSHWLNSNKNTTQASPKQHWGRFLSAIYVNGKPDFKISMHIMWWWLVNKKKFLLGETFNFLIVLN